MMENIVRCNRCGKIMTDVDEMAGFGYTDMLDYSMEHADKVFDIDLCPDCWHWLMSLLQQECVIDPLVHIDDDEDDEREAEAASEPCECCCEERPHCWTLSTYEPEEYSREGENEFDVYDSSVRIKTKNFTINICGEDSTSVLGDLLKVFHMKEKEDEQAN